MKQEYILDIGIGAGGEYIRSCQNAQRVGVDLVQSELKALSQNYPEVLRVCANAAHLPFASDTFSRIEMILPAYSLICPALQTGHFLLTKQYNELCQAQYPLGWYPEFQRVLQPQGQIIIYADLWVDPIQVATTSTPLFMIEDRQKLTIDKFSQLNTPYAHHLLTRLTGSYVNEAGQYWQDMLCKITLRSTRTE